MTDTGMTLRELRPSDANWVMRQHVSHYTSHDGFDATFEATVAEVLDEFLRNRDHAVDRAWIATRNGQRFGCIFCTGETNVTSRLRLFLVVPEARGRGVGKHLLTACIDHARDRGFTFLRLWTHESHTAACALYRAAGFEMIDSRPVRSYGQDLVEQIWQLRL